jgi:putative transposase
VTLWFLYRAFCRVIQLIRLICRSDTDLAVEVVVLRHEVAVLRRQVHRPALEPADRAVLAGLSRLLPRQRLGHLFVQPSTLLRWHRDLVAKRWTYPHGRPGRPAIPEGITAVVLRLAKENPQWGYRRIQGELATMGVVIAASSVWATLKRHGIDPSPRRSGPTWAEFLAAQAKGLMACDFFHVDTVLLRRLYVLVFIHHDSRRVQIAGITSNPVAGWVTQQARNLSMELADQANAIKFLVRDRDTKFTASFDAVFAADGTRVITTPVRAPQAKDVASYCTSWGWLGCFSVGDSPAARRDKSRIARRRWVVEMLVLVVRPVPDEQSGAVPLLHGLGPHAQLACDLAEGEQAGLSESVPVAWEFMVAARLIRQRTRTPA